MSEYGIEGMKCHTCVGKITDALLEAGYKNVFVTLKTRKFNSPSESTVILAS